MKLTSIGLTVVGLMLSSTCVMAANSITTAPTNGIIGGATQTIQQSLASGKRFQQTLAYRPQLLRRALAVPSVRFLRRAKFFRIPQEIFRIRQEVFRCRQTHPALVCHPQGAEDNDAAVPCVG